MLWVYIQPSEFAWTRDICDLALWILGAETSEKVNGKMDDHPNEMIFILCRNPLRWYYLGYVYRDVKMIITYHIYNDIYIYRLSRLSMLPVAICVIPPNLRISVFPWCWYARSLPMSMRQKLNLLEFSHFCGRPPSALVSWYGHGNLKWRMEAIPC